MGENVPLNYSKNTLTPKICYESQKYFHKRVKVWLAQGIL